MKHSVRRRSLFPEPLAGRTSRSKLLYPGNVYCRVEDGTSYGRNFLWQFHAKSQPCSFLLSAPLCMQAISFILIGVATYTRSAAIVTNISIISGMIGCGLLLLLLSLLGLIGTRKHNQVMLFFVSGLPFFFLHSLLQHPLLLVLVCIKA